jgi:hypothetical protein
MCGYREMKIYVHREEEKEEEEFSDAAKQEGGDISAL